jgi:hypothetical protein
MLLRMLVIVCVVLAAARPVVPWGGGTSHPPAALALIVDNSLSSNAVVEGRPILEVLRGRARAIAARVSPDDRLWLVTADGIPRAVTALQLGHHLDTLTAQPLRLDLGDAVRSAAVPLGESGRSLREIAVVSDLQASAVTGGEPVPVPVLVAVPPSAPANIGVDSVLVEPPVWTVSGEVVAAIGGARDEPVAVRVEMDGEERARAIGSAGAPVVLPVERYGTGWLAGVVRVDPDELRADDQRWFAVRATSPVAVRADVPLGPFVTEGLDVLIEAGRLRSGGAVTLGDRPAPGSSVVFPPADPAMLGATNRALAAAGVAWRFADVLDGEWVLDEPAGPTPGVAVYRRYRLTGAGTVVRSVGGQPWLVRDGRVTVVASRLLPDWTALPTSASFLPFLHRLIAEVAVGEAGVVNTLSGQPTTVPSDVSFLSMPAGDIRVPETRVVRAPSSPGVYGLIDTGADTVGVLVVNHDPRESDLTRATETAVRSAWGSGARVLTARELESRLFGGAARAELSAVLLVVALVAALSELVLSSVGARAARS